MDVSTYLRIYINYAVLTLWHRYFLKAIKWARKYGLRINLDLHALPGSQNGWNHSGRLGTIGFLNGPMGYANAQRSLDYIRIFAEFITQPQYKDVVTIFGIMNEPQGTPMGQDQLSRLYIFKSSLARTHLIPFFNLATLRRTTSFAQLAELEPAMVPMSHCTMDFSLVPAGSTSSPMPIDSRLIPTRIFVSLTNPPPLCHHMQPLPAPPGELASMPRWVPSV